MKIAILRPLEEADESHRRSCDNGLRTLDAAIAVTDVLVVSFNAWCLRNLRWGFAVKES